MNVLSSDVFNAESTDSIPWKSLSLENRIDKVKEYLEKEFTDLNMTKETKYLLISVVEKGNMKLKKEVFYDEINCRIIKINSIVKNGNVYVYRPDELIKKNTTRTRAKNVLFRK